MFEYREGMTLGEMAVAVERMIDWMRTDEYWLTHGGNQPKWYEGGDLMKEYLKATDAEGIPRMGTMIVPFNEVCNQNLMRPNMLDRTTTGKVTIVMMSGREVEFDIQGVAHIDDLFFQLPDDLVYLGEKRLTLFDGERELTWDSRVIVTDDSVWSLVVSERDDGSDSEYDGSDSEFDEAEHVGQNDDW